MSDAAIEAIGRIYAGWERGDFSVGEAEFDPEAVLVIDPEIPEAGEYAGLEGIRRYTRGFLEPWERLTIVPGEIERKGDRVLVSVRQDGIGRDSGASVGFDYFHLWTVRKGKIVRLESILREDAARKAMSAPER